jgi:hypothetical protein
MSNAILRATIITLVALVAAACASTTMQGTWTDPGYAGGPFRKIFVIRLSATDVTTRRVFEDIVSAKLAAAGVQAVPAWQQLRSDGAVDEASMAAAIVASGADALLMARVLGVDSRVSVSTAMVPGPGYGWYGPYAGWYAVPQVTQYEIATVETTLFDTKTKRLVWSGTSETFNPASVQREAPGYADVVVAALRKSGFLPPTK